MAKEVKANEPGTLQYQITQSSDDANVIEIWEEVSDNVFLYEDLHLACQDKRARLRASTRMSRLRRVSDLFLAFLEL